MANITLWGASYTDVPAILLPQTGSGTVRFTEVSDTTATASTVLYPNYFYTANGTRTQGTVAFVTYYTGSGAPSSSLGNDGDIYLRTG